MTDLVTLPRWRAAAASKRGSSHASGMPNQDAVRTASVTDRRGSAWLVAAVSDGHGGPRYVRSDVGSRIAVEVTVEVLGDELCSRSAGEPPVEMLRRQAPVLVDRWRETVLAHASAHPFTEEEALRAGVDRLTDEPLLAYGATLLVAVVGEEGVGIAQIGDGDALVRTSGFATRPVPGDPRLVAGETTSLCLPSAADDFRFASLPGSAEPDLVLLATDGYANSFAEATWWHEVVGDLAGFLATEEFEAFEQRLPDWLAESALIGGDDVSAVLLARVPLLVDPRRAGEPARGDAPEAQRPVRPVVPGLPMQPERRTLPEEAVDDPRATYPRRRVALIVVAAMVVLVLICVAAAVVLAGRGGSGDDPSPGVSVSPRPTPSESSPDGSRGTRSGGAGGAGHQGPGKPGEPDSVGGPRSHGPPPEGGPARPGGTTP